MITLLVLLSLTVVLQSCHGTFRSLCDCPAKLTAMQRRVLADHALKSGAPATRANPRVPLQHQSHPLSD